MPLTPFQRDLLRVIASNRSEASHFAGGIVLNAADGSPRFSRDFDIFHETAAEVTRASERDAASLRAAGYEVDPVDRYGDWDKESTFRKATVRRAANKTEIDWAADSAFRFFPIESDPVLGWRLHLFDMATNKALALTARTVTRDYVDIVELMRSYPLAAICWAASGKDPGFSPRAVLEWMRRYARVDPLDLEEMQARQLDPRVLKTEWNEASLEAEEKITRLADEQPETPIGVAFVDATGKPGWLGDDPSLRAHAPSLRGCWPTIHGLEA